MLPIEIIKTDEIKTPSNRILVRCLIAAIAALSSVIIFLAKGGNSISRAALMDCQASNAKKDLQIEKLNEYIIKEAQDDIRWFKEREAKIDSIVKKSNH